MPGRRALYPLALGGRPRKTMRSMDSVSASAWAQEASEAVAPGSVAWVLLLSVRRVKLKSLQWVAQARVCVRRVESSDCA